MSTYILHPYYSKAGHLLLSSSGNGTLSITKSGLLDSLLFTGGGLTIFVQYAHITRAEIASRQIPPLCFMIVIFS